MKPEVVGIVVGGFGNCAVVVVAGVDGVVLDTAAVQHVEPSQGLIVGSPDIAACDSEVAAEVAAVAVLVPSGVEEVAGRVVVPDQPDHEQPPAQA